MSMHPAAIIRLVIAPTAHSRRRALRTARKRSGSSSGVMPRGTSVVPAARTSRKGRETMDCVTLSNGVQMPPLGHGVYQVTKDEYERCVANAPGVGHVWRRARLHRLGQKADYQAGFRLSPSDAAPEIKERSGGKYLYVRKRGGSSLASTWGDVCSNIRIKIVIAKFFHY